METRTHIINYSEGKLIKDIIFDNSGYWGIDEEGKLIHNDVIVCHLSSEIRLEFPFFRAFNENAFLIIDGEYAKDQYNAWIISRNGVLKEQFYIGEGACKVLVLNEKIIVAYSDAIIGGCPIGTNRLVVFDKKGTILRKFGFELGQEMKAICAKNEHEIYLQELYPPHVVCINLSTWSMTKFKFPLKAYADMMTCCNEILYFGMLNPVPETEEDIKNGTMTLYQSTIHANSEIDLDEIGMLACQGNARSLQNDGTLVFTDYFFRKREDGKLQAWIADVNEWTS